MSKYASSLPERGPELQAPLSRVREKERERERGGEDATSSAPLR